MPLVNSFIDFIRRGLRGMVRFIAPILNTLTGGKLTPNMVTITGLLAHIPIAWLIAMQHNIWAASLLFVFGLFDALDGELARLQKSANNSGMLLDATTDRMKEVLIYTGAAYAMVAMGYQYWAIWAVLACGGSLCVSYVKAKGETTVAGKIPASEANRLFQDGLMRFEVRMTLVFLGLLTNHLILAVVIIAITSWYTAFDRLIKISRSLNRAER